MDTRGTKTIPHSPLLPIEIGELPAGQTPETAAKTLRKLIETEEVPTGPYPYKHRSAGWTMLYFDQPGMDLRYTPAEGSTCRLDVGFFNSTTGKTGEKAEKIKTTLRQQIFKKKSGKLVESAATWVKEFTIEKAHSIIANEKKNGQNTRNLSRST